MMKTIPRYTWLLATILICTTESCQQYSPISTDAQADLASFELMEGFRIELVAAEPLIADPVAMEIDENGTVYVVEMHGYPLDVSGNGKVKVLKDTDGDGQADQATLFADNLTLPTGIMRWKNGVIVTDAPDVIYLEDTDGDGQADKREVLLTGFARSNPQHNLNNPMLGLDNWIYLAHESSISTKFFEKEFGDKGESIRFAQHPDAPQLDRNAHGRNVRFKPDRLALEALSGESQFGQTFDQWGHHLLTSNAHHLFHEVIQAPYANRNPALFLPDATANIPDHGNACEIYPITQNPQHQLLTDVGVITSACGVTWYTGDLFPEPFQQVTFVAEPVHNLVHADVIEPEGATFKASRLLKGKEFLASKDAWFRPVNFYIGPEGALYVMDYHRQIIEHPEWMSDEVNQSGALYNGQDKGRIYRIVPEDAPKMPFPGGSNLADADEYVWLQALESPNSWWRRHAQQLLLNSPIAYLEELLFEFAQDTESPLAYLHALWLLHEKGVLDPQTILTALQHPEAGVRENAIKLAELHLSDSPLLLPSLLGMQRDEDPRVRFQLACTLGNSDLKESQQAKASLLLQDLDDYWVQMAVLSGKPGQEGFWLDFAIRELSQPMHRRGEDVEGRAVFFQLVSAMIGKGGSNKDLDRLLEVVAEKGTASEAWWRAACLAGLREGWVAKRHPQHGNKIQSVALGLFHPETPALVREQAVALLAKIGLPEHSPDVELAVKMATVALETPSMPDSYQSDAIRLLALYAPDRYAPMLEARISPQSALPVQLAAIQGLAGCRNQQPFQHLLSKWPQLSPEIREAVIGVLVKKKENIDLLLDALATKQVDIGSISWPRAVHLMNHQEESVRERARKLLNINQQPEKALLAQYAPICQEEGQVDRGLAIFQKHCQMCHQLGPEIGKAFGPDLSGLRNRSKEAILADILLPNRSIADGYEFWTATLRNGETVQGILVNESAQHIVLKDLGGNEHPIDRHQIASLQAAAYSVMPEGLGRQIAPEQMRDLLELLKKGVVRL